LVKQANLCEAENTKLAGCSVHAFESNVNASAFDKSSVGRTTEYNPALTD
jgi:hypothetical protein